MVEIDETFEVPDASATIASFLASGDFDIKIDTKDANGPYGCVNIKFAVKPSKPWVFFSNFSLYFFNKDI